MTAEERVIDVEAANQRLAEMNLEPATEPLEFRDVSTEYATQQGQKPPSKRRSDAGQPKPRPAPRIGTSHDFVSCTCEDCHGSGSALCAECHADHKPTPTGLSDKQWARLSVLIETQLQTAISRRDAAQRDDFAKAALADYLDELRNPRGPQNATKVGA